MLSVFNLVVAFWFFLHRGGFYLVSNVVSVVLSCVLSCTCHLFGIFALGVCDVVNLLGGAMRQSIRRDAHVHVY